MLFQRIRNTLIKKRMFNTVIFVDEYTIVFQTLDCVQLKDKIELSNEHEPVNHLFTVKSYKLLPQFIVYEV